MLAVGKRAGPADGGLIVALLEFARTLVLNHLGEMREAWESGQAIVWYYAVGIAAHNGASLEPMDIRRDVPNRRDDSIRILFECEAIREFDDQGNAIRHPFATLTALHSKFFSHLRAVTPYVASDSKLTYTDFLPWSLGTTKFDSDGDSFTALRSFALRSKEVDWGWSAKLAKMNARQWRAFIDQGEAWVKSANTPGQHAKLLEVLRYGTFPPDGFFYKGTAATIWQPKAWKLIDALWYAPNRTLEVVELWGVDAEFVETSTFASARRDANNFFKQNGLPFMISVNLSCVRLRQTT